MPTNDERRKVAAKLRELAQESARCGDDGVGERACRVLLGPRVDLLDVVDAHFPLAHLADLIEPEERTCKRGLEMFSHAYPNEIVCDSDCVSTYVFPLTCGHEAELLKNEWPNYCPVCGAKVVVDHA